MNDKTLMRPAGEPPVEGDPDAADPASEKYQQEPGLFESLEEPNVLKGRFELKEQLGAGGMGVVFRTWDRSQDLFIALKVINADPGDGSWAVQRAAFRAEAKKTLTLSHPNIVRTYDFDLDGDIDFLTMELLEGESF